MRDFARKERALGGESADRADGLWSAQSGTASERCKAPSSPVPGEEISAAGGAPLRWV